MSRKTHWERVDVTRSPDAVGWFQPRPTLSLRLMESAGVPPDAGIIDVGAGASTLVDELLERGYDDISALDLSRSGVQHIQQRLGERAEQVQWIEADVTRFHPERCWDLWHDRAVLHFLTDPADRKGYRRALEEGVAPDGHAIIATFGLEGPKRCSGLEVVRYSPATLSAELGDAFELREARGEDHLTPTGVVQPFVFCLFRRRG
jgi:2-polyprenyl-3-methyl-5-hydroxy-6-metoxy-1,4-benzoquinol methylase